MPTKPDPDDTLTQYTGSDRCPSCDGWGQIQSLHCACPACAGKGRRDARTDAAPRQARRG
jgi:DnaJ-class molecular chaperone